MAKAGQAPAQENHRVSLVTGRLRAGLIIVLLLLTMLGVRLFQVQAVALARDTMQRLRRVL